MHLQWNQGTPEHPRAEDPITIVLTCSFSNASNVSSKIIDDMDLMVRSVIASTMSAVHFHALVNDDCGTHMRRFFADKKLPAQVNLTVQVANATLALAGCRAINVRYGLHACFTEAVHALLPDLDFAVIVDLDVVFVSDVALLWHEFHEFLPTEVFAHSKQRAYQTRPPYFQYMYSTLHTAWDTYNSGVVLVNLQKYRQLLAQVPPNQLEIKYRRHIKSLTAMWTTQQRINRDQASLFVYQKVLNAYHFWVPQVAHILAPQWNVFSGTTASILGELYQNHSWQGALHKLGAAQYREMRHKLPEWSTLASDFDARRARFCTAQSRPRNACPTFLVWPGRPSATTASCYD